MQQIFKKFNSGNILCLLLFLFPLFALGVRHWSSITFSLLILLGIIYCLVKQRKEPVQLHKYERLYLWFLVFYFAVFLISMLLNPFERFGDTRFGNEIRFILIIPLYFLLLRTQQAMRYLVHGSTAAIIIGFGFCIHELYIEGSNRFLGEYSKLFTGPVILLYLVVVLSYWIPQLSRNNLKLWFYLIILIVLATFSIVATEVRAAYIGYVGLSILFVVFYIRGWLRIASIIILVGFITIISFSSESINSRMTAAINELNNYIAMPDHTDPDNNAAGSSVGVRIEMWRAAPLFLRDYPFFGAGNGNYQKTVAIYVKQRKLHPAAKVFSHPHNVFVGATVDKGIFGLTATLLVFFFPLYVYIKTYRASPYSALTGIIYVTVMFVFSMNETAPFDKSNFVATYLVYALVIFQYHMQKIKTRLES